MRDDDQLTRAQDTRGRRRVTKSGWYDATSKGRVDRSAKPTPATRRADLTTRRKAMGSIVKSAARPSPGALRGRQAHAEGHDSSPPAASDSLRHAAGGRHETDVSHRRGTPTGSQVPVSRTTRSDSHGLARPHGHRRGHNRHGREDLRTRLGDFKLMLDVASGRRKTWRAREAAQCVVLFTPAPVT